MLVNVDTQDIKTAISCVIALPCAYNGCPGDTTPHAEGITCLRCATLIQMNSWLPERDRIPGIAGYQSEEEENQWNAENESH